MQRFGAILQPYRTSQEGGLMKCANCGMVLPPNYTQCPNCGNAKEFIQEEPQRKNKTLVYIIVGLAVIALLATIIGVMVNGLAHG